MLHKIKVFRQLVLYPKKEKQAQRNLISMPVSSSGYSTIYGSVIRLSDTIDGKGYKDITILNDEANTTRCCIGRCNGHRKASRDCADF